jgi:nucleoside-diphosphate-sugar epimerase
MKLVIFGSTGMGGKAVLAKAIERGYDVTILARSEASAARAPEGTHVVRGDALDRAAIREALKGTDAVVQYLGVGGLGDGRPNDLVPDATRLIVAEMKAQNIQRLVCAGNVGVPGSGAFVFRHILIPLVARKLLPILEAKVKMEALLRDCGLEWTTVRLPALTEKPDKKRLKVSAAGRGTGLSITTGDAGNFMLDIIEKRQFIGAAVAISN